VTGGLPQLPIRVGKQMFPIDFHVTGATTFDLLLGTDFHLMAKPTISWSDKTMTLKGGDIVPLELSGGDHEAHVMIGATNLRVPSHKCSIAPLVKTANAKRHGTGGETKWERCTA